ncbi:hypothetical protein CR513_42500, partial [Mucuna pruriens]
MAKGYTQMYDIDYEKTFSLVAKLNINVFLHGGLKEEVYMDIPPDYVVSSQDKLSNADHTLFLKHHQEKMQLSIELKMKNLGGLKYFLEIEIARSCEGIFISQRKHVLDLLFEVGMLDCKPVGIPMEQNQKLDDKGKLIYLSHTRLDITYAVSIVSQYMYNPSKRHMKAKIYIRIFHLWRSKKQKVIALSSAEAEFQRISKGLCKLLWVRRLLIEIGFEPKIEMNLFCENKATIEIAHNPVQHDRTKYIKIDRHFIKQILEEKMIKFPFCSI